MVISLLATADVLQFAEMNKYYYTTKNNNHRHKWKRGNKYTSMNHGHKHKIRGRMALSSADGHKHRLLMKKVKRY